MVAAYCDAGGAHWRFVVRPNNSLSWQGNMVILAVFATVTALIATFFVVLGAWPVLPFAGLELAVVALVLHVCAVRGLEREVISIHGDVIAVERGRFGPRDRVELPRVWARVRLARGASRGHPSRLIIRSHGQEVEVGACLLENERQDLAQALHLRLAGPNSTAARMP